MCVCVFEIENGAYGEDQYDGRNDVTRSVIIGWWVGRENAIRKKANRPER